MKHFPLNLLLFIGIVASIYSCSYENEEELFPASDCDVSLISYSLNIIPLMDENCNGCHSANEASGGVVLDSFDAIQALAEDGVLFCSVNHDDGCSEMPQDSPKLPECAILTLKTWIDDGALNN